MKNILLIFFLSGIIYQNSFGQVGIGTTKPHESAIMEVKSTNKGFLVPRLTTVQRVNIINPEIGLLVFDTDFKCLLTFSGNDNWTGYGECNYSSAITFIDLDYNGPSPIDSLGIGYYNEPIENTSTIGVQVNAIDKVPYSFVAEDNTTGLQYTASGITGIGTQTIELVPNTVTISSPGTINMNLEGGSNTIVLTPRIDIKSLDAANTTVVDMPLDLDNADGDNDHSTGVDQIWMDRVLGAHQAATNSTDELARGSFFQWGRASDGHEIIVYNGDTPQNARNLNGFTNIQATGTSPGHNQMITTHNNWTTSTTNLWQGAGGVNNPCPSGYRVPTEIEVTSLNTYMGNPNLSDLYSNETKFISTGHTWHVDSIVYNVNSGFYLWTSSISSQNQSPRLRSTNLGNQLNPENKAYSFSVRCIKD